MCVRVLAASGHEEGAAGYLRRLGEGGEQRWMTRMSAAPEGQDWRAQDRTGRQLGEEGRGCAT